MARAEGSRKFNSLMNQNEPPHEPGTVSPIVEMHPGDTIVCPQCSMVEEQSRDCDRKMITAGREYKAREPCVHCDTYYSISMQSSPACFENLEVSLTSRNRTSETLPWMRCEYWTLSLTIPYDPALIFHSRGPSATHAWSRGLSRDIERYP